ncbi:RNA polymerase sigma factor [Snuella sedimenti]|uniref:Sigma-70 family RNA polymerase sigma factor n=1 Tax=Snuella sedimenti TaxID=2798802 RepID=A0A8J7JDV7_9FLAO|nr:sigma-70 family RNA polymerase sigma factor [Snuella sedimenti]MBJ6369394.1 sigma-70 family RNA polymerase sigma factor [Snuella sedimenti]
MTLKFKNLHVLMSQLKKGDESAYVYLINTHHKMLVNYAASFTNDLDMAKDIVQEVFLDVWKGRQNLPHMHSLKNYLLKITYHKFINQYHKHRALSTLECAYMEVLNQTFEENNSELLERKIALVAEGIDNLPKKCKEAFILSKKEGLTNLEIAEYMNISIKTVEGHLTKAYNLLRERVGSQLKSILFLIFGSQKKV